MKIKLQKVFTLNRYYVALTSAFITVALLLNLNAIQIFNQDMMHPASFLVGWRKGVTLSTWHWSPNNYFFPDLVFYGLVNFLFGFLSPVHIQTLYMLFSSFIFVLSIYQVSSKIFNLSVVLS
jgi:hypothetical protein